MYDLIIIGSGPAGLAAAIYAQRAKLNTLVIERAMVSGGQVLNTYEVDNYPGLPGIGGYELGMKFREHADKLGALFAEDEVVRVEDEGAGKVKRVVGEKDTYEAKSLILATGAHHRLLEVPGEKELSGAGVSYCATCDGAFFRNKVTAVVGGGDTALTDALVLANYAETVSLIHRRAQFRGSPLLQRRVRENPKIQLRLDRRVQSLSGEKKLDGLTLTRTDDGSQEELACDGLFVAVGIQPRTGFLQGVLDLDEQGRIRTHRDLSTSVPGIYAAGDCRDTLLRQVVTAAADGALAATMAAERLLAGN